MKQKRWVRLDNASKIFLATMTTTDTKVFRISAAVKDPVNPEILQQALDETYANFTLYHCVLRRGIFWYYMEDSDLKPKVSQDNQPPCSSIYKYDTRNLLFRVTYFQNRIHLEVFHALSDGTGALWFMKDLLYNYIIRHYPEVFQDNDLGYNEKESQKQIFDDSFASNFGIEGAQETLSSVAQMGKSAGKAAFRMGRNVAGAVTDRGGKKRVYHIRGIKTPDNRMHVVEADMPVKEVLRLSKGAGTTLTIYLMALFIDAVHKDVPKSKEGWTIAVSVPINLRQYFKSNSARNFFSTMRVQYTYGLNGPGEDSLESICRSLENQFKEQLTKEKLEKKLKQLMAYEMNPLVRVTIRPIKDLILKIANAHNNSTLTVAISNIGKIVFPDEFEDFIDQLYLQTSAIRPQFCSISHKDRLTICFTSPFQETEIQKNYIRVLTEKGVTVTIAANNVNLGETPGKMEKEQRKEM